MGASARTASAIASEGRESTSNYGAILLDGDLRVEGVLAQFGYGDLDDLRAELAEDVGHEIVRHRSRRRGVLQLHQDRGRLRMADPDREEAIALDRLQENDRLPADEVEAHPVDVHLLHRRASWLTKSF